MKLDFSYERKLTADEFNLAEKLKRCGISAIELKGEERYNIVASFSLLTLVLYRKQDIHMNKIRNRFNRFDTVFNRLITSFVVLVVVVALFIGGILTIQFSVNYNQKIEKLEQYRLDYLGGNMSSLFEKQTYISDIRTGKPDLLILP